MDFQNYCTKWKLTSPTTSYIVLYVLYMSISGRKKSRKNNKPVFQNQGHAGLPQYQPLYMLSTSSFDWWQTKTDYWLCPGAKIWNMFQNCAHSSELKYPTLFQITGWWSDFTGLVLCQYLLDCHKFGTDWKLSRLAFTCSIHVQLRGFSWKVLPAYLKIGLFSENGCIKFRPENDYF